ncbi:MAG: isopentenyl-diphosphate Delta-isomerase [Psychromonas sp.]|nr:isopentenyl-diphosphate Delta-isomerase [Alteromonadales bacterium]MCP5077333.1 isopentenyl-diphosphate Delta-isomerase [Psychromonas sp.]
MVSFDTEQLILVNDADVQIGQLAKGECHHTNGKLHRAFSVFVFNPLNQTILLQRRAKAKLLWGGYWSNTCCSHPRAGEVILEAANRRLAEELGLHCKLEYCYQFQYRAEFRDSNEVHIGTENELCHVFVGISSDLPTANVNEVSDWRYESIDVLDKKIAESPEIFTPWLKLEWQMLREQYFNKTQSLIQSSEHLGR